MPYTYLITHIPSGMKYYGVRYAKNSSPSDLWNTYFTSSKTIKNLILQDGKDAFLAEVRKIFITAEEAISWEIRVLNKLGVPYNDKYFNVGKNHPQSQEEKEQSMIKKYGVKNASQHPLLKQKAIDTWIEKYGVDNPNKYQPVKEKIKNTINEKYGADCSWKIPGVLEKSKQARVERYGVEFSMQNPELVEKSKDSQFKKFGNWKVQTQEVRKKVVETNIEKYGVDNPFKVPGLVKNIMIEKYGVENWMQTEEGRKSISNGWKNRIPMRCPHCGKESKAFSNMNRWHFDNCKSLK